MYRKNPFNTSFRICIQFSHFDMKYNTLFNCSLRLLIHISLKLVLSILLIAKLQYWLRKTSLKGCFSKQKSVLSTSPQRKHTYLPRQSQKWLVEILMSLKIYLLCQLMVKDLEVTTHQKFLWIALNVQSKKRLTVRWLSITMKNMGLSLYWGWDATFVIGSAQKV